MTLYVTDLDGTLLNNDKCVSEYSKLQLKKLINKGINFTVATARTPATVVDILSDIELNIPAVLMNGVLLYDIKNKKYIDVKNIDKDVTNKILDIFDKYNKNPLVYGIKDHKINVFYKNLVCRAEEIFYNERKDSKFKKFVKVENYKEYIENLKIINFITFGEYKIVKEIYNEIKEIYDIEANFYEDIYNRGTYFLEVYSKSASKSNGIEALKEYVNYDKLVVFGDNVNDIPMFKIANEGYAMLNAVDELKNIATEVIDSNDNDGVLKKVNSQLL